MAAHGERYLDIHKVADKVGLSTRTIRRKVKLREFPPPFRFGGGFRWLESDVDRWMIRMAVTNEIDPDEIDPDEKKPPPERGQGADNRGQSGTSSPDEAAASSEKRKRG